MVIYGIDSEGAPTHAVRFWMFEEGDIVTGRVYIVRGLRVIRKRIWDFVKCKYVPKTDGPNTLDCTYRTALEDVTGVDVIARCFA